jgi:hypothetical protein
VIIFPSTSLLLLLLYSFLNLFFFPSFLLSFYHLLLIFSGAFLCNLSLEVSSLLGHLSCLVFKLAIWIKHGHFLCLSKLPWIVAFHSAWRILIADFNHREIITSFFRLNLIYWINSAKNSLTVRLLKFEWALKFMLESLMMVQLNRLILTGAMWLEL